MNAPRFIQTSDDDMIAVGRIVSVHAEVANKSVGDRWYCFGVVFAFLLTASNPGADEEVSPRVQRHDLWAGDDYFLAPGPWAVDEKARQREELIWEAEQDARRAQRRVCEAMGGIVQWDRWGEETAEGTAS